MAEDHPQRRARGRPKAFHDKTDQNTIQSLDRALTVLKTLADQSGQSLSELATLTGQNTATLYRILTTFARHEIAEFNEPDQLWHIGPGAYQIGSSFLRRTSVVERARPMLRKLMQETDETANLGIEQANMVLFVSQVETHQSIRAFFPPGTQSEMHASGIGKALLANFPLDRMKHWLATQPMSRFTEETICDPQALANELAKIRETGFSFDNEEKNIGMRCIAAPIFNAMGEPVAGLSVSGPTSRMTDGRIDVIANAVKSAAMQVTRAIGGSKSGDQ